MKNNKEQEFFTILQQNKKTDEPIVL